MDKAHAIKLLGGSVTSAAKAIGISPSAISQWPETLTARLADRVHAAKFRLDHPRLYGNKRKAKP